MNFKPSQERKKRYFIYCPDGALPVKFWFSSVNALPSQFSFGSWPPGFSHTDVILADASLTATKVTDNERVITAIVNTEFANFEFNKCIKGLLFNFRQ